MKAISRRSLSVGLGLATALVAGCSSAPPEREPAAQSETALNFVPGGFGVDPGLMGLACPAARLQPLKTDQCYLGVEGFFVRVPSGAACPTVIVNGLQWAADNPTADIYYGGARPAWNGPDTLTRYVCSYSYSGITLAGEGVFGGLQPYPSSMGVSVADEASLSAGLCDALSAAGVRQGDWRYMSFDACPFSSCGTPGGFCPSQGGACMTCYEN
jgi:hypothetical protein